MTLKRFPKGLRHRVHRYFKQYFEQRTALDECAILNDLDPALREEVGPISDPAGDGSGIIEWNPASIPALREEVGGPISDPAGYGSGIIEWNPASIPALRERGGRPKW